MNSTQLPMVSDLVMPAFIVAGDDDLLTEILKRLPVISLIRFKSVCKHWLSLITHPFFSRLRNPSDGYPSGLFLRSPHSITEFDFVPLDAQNPIKAPFRTLNFAPGITILSSCNGLLLCGNITSRNVSHFYVYNPSNQKLAIVPPPNFGSIGRIIAVYLAFDPLKSPFYKVISFVLVSIYSPQIYTFSSETAKWKLSAKSVNMSLNTVFDLGVYLNGAIHWFSQSLYTIYFDVDQERNEVMPMPPTTNESESQRRRNRYFGESSGHLHLIETYGAIKREFDVFEMKSDRSGWFVKYHVNLNALVDMCPEMILERHDSVDQLQNCFHLLYLLETESNGDSYLLLQIPGKIMRYNLIDNTFKLHLDFDTPGKFDYFQRYHYWSGSIPFIASLSCI